MKHIFVIGSGGFSKQVIEIVEEINSSSNRQKYLIKGIIDDDLKKKGKNVLGYEIVGDTDYLKKISSINEINAVIAIGNGQIRKRIADKLLNVNWVNLIHPKAVISKHGNIGIGNIVCAGAIINPMYSIGNHININIGCTVGHDVNLNDFSTLNPGCNISGNVNIEMVSMIGTGSCIIQGIRVGQYSIVGAGAVVIKDVDPFSLYVGVPATKVNK
ncbi:acetyltransferase [Sporosarcina sp. FSL W8-0480]|uniref:acetyltransferase n=1 Tax=Sporosarcina sp. FSL W8-0480 TaxID=2954701 RepID=UPI0030D7E507